MVEIFVVPFLTLDNFMGPKSTYMYVRSTSSCKSPNIDTSSQADDEVFSSENRKAYHNLFVRVGKWACRLSFSSILQESLGTRLTQSLVSGS